MSFYVVKLLACECFVSQIQKMTPYIFAFALKDAPYWLGSYMRTMNIVRIGNLKQKYSVSIGIASNQRRP